MANIPQPPPLSHLSFSDQHIKWAEDMYEAIRFKGYLGYMEGTDWEFGPGASLTNRNGIASQAVMYTNTDVFDTEQCIDNVAFSGGTASTYIVPEGIFRVRWACQIYTDINTLNATASRFVLLPSTNSAFGQNAGVPFTDIIEIGITGGGAAQFASTVIEVNPGDILQCTILLATTSAISGFAIVYRDERSWMSIEFIN